MNSKNSKTCDPYRLLLNLTNNIEVIKEVISMLFRQIFPYTKH